MDSSQQSMLTLLYTDWDWIGRIGLGELGCFEKKVQRKVIKNSSKPMCHKMKLLNHFNSTD